MRSFIVLPFAGLIALAACSFATQQKVEKLVSTAADKIETACADASRTVTALEATPLGAVPQINGVFPYVTAACGSAGAVAAMTEKAVNDPATVAWVANLNTMLQADIAKVHAL